MPWPTLLFDISFGTPDVFGSPGQRKPWFPSGVNVAQLSAAIAARDRQDIYYEEPDPEPTWFPPLPVEEDPWFPVIYGEEAVIRSVLPRPMGGGSTPVPRTTVVVGDVSTEVEQHPEGDFPAGSIFAPGQAWEPEPHGLDQEPEPDEDEDMAHDWGHLIRQGVGGILGIESDLAALPVNQFMPQQQPAFTRPSGRAALPPSAAPVNYANGDACGNRRYVTLDRETGKISCKRRRRRRLLTNRDLADLASLKTITGGGAALNAAVIRAVR